MNHDDALKAMDREHVEGITAGEREELDAHLETCVECARRAAATGEALRALRSISVPVPAALAARAQLRVYLRAKELRGRRQGWVLWGALAISWALGLATAPYVWRAFHWVGEHAGLPDPVWKTGFTLWWAVPALLAVAVLLIDRWSEKRSENVE